MKWCPECKEMRSDEMFKRESGLSTKRCKICRDAFRASEHYKRNNQRIRDQRARWREEDGVSPLAKEMISKRWV